MSLERLRTEIQEIDERIVRLLYKRMQKVSEVTEHKANEGLSVEDRTLERSKLERLKSLARELDLNDEAIENLFVNVFHMAKEQEYLGLHQGFKVGMLGPKGTYSEEAAVKVYGSSKNFIYFPTIEEVIRAVEYEDIDYGFVPIENSIEGTVTSTIDTLIRSKVSVVEEVVYPVKHTLLARKGTLLEGVEEVLSHPQAIAQCSGYITRILPSCTLTPTSSTAEAARLVSVDGKKAAIASARLSEVYGLEVLSTDIQDVKTNETRFFILAKRPRSREPNRSYKTAIFFAVQDEPGSLYRVLSEFAENKINLTKLESRPSKLKLGEYTFYLEFSGNITDEPIQGCLRSIQSSITELKIFGSF